MKNLVFRTLCRVFTCAAAPIVAIAVLVTLFRRRGQLAGCSRLILGGGGFGWTIVAPDAARRMWPDRSAILFIAPAGRHNPLVEHIFPDISVLILSIPASVRVLGRAFPLETGGWLMGLLHGLVATAFRRWCGRDVVSWRYGFDDSLPEPEMGAMPGGRLRLAAAVHRSNAFPRYYRLRQRVPAPPAALPDRLRAPVQAALEELDRTMGRRPRDICCLYLRNRGSSEMERETFIRSGSPLADYEPALSALVTRGYRVLVMGDRELDPEFARRFDGMLVDHRRIGIDSRLFSLYAPIEARFAICEAGGGVNIPMVAERPMLLVNWLQYFAAVPEASHHYKALYDERGEKVPYRRLFTEFAFDQHLAGMVVKNNTPDELKAAIVDFVERIESSRPLGAPPEVLEPMDRDVWLRFAPCWISVPWLESNGIAVSESTRDGSFARPKSMSQA